MSAPSTVSFVCSEEINNYVFYLMKIFIYPENKEQVFLKRQKQINQNLKIQIRSHKKYDLLRNVTCLCVLCFYNFTILF